MKSLQQAAVRSSLIDVRLRLFISKTTEWYCGSQSTGKDLGADQQRTTSTSLQLIRALGIVNSWSSRKTQEQWKTIIIVDSARARSTEWSSISKICNVPLQFTMVNFWKFYLMWYDCLLLLQTCKCYMKGYLKFLPIIGFSWWCTEFVFLRRNWQKDQKVLERSLSTLQDFPFPFWVGILFITLCLVFLCSII